MITCTPGFARSLQSLICFGLPWRTRNTIVVEYGELPFGRRVRQFFGSNWPRSASRSMSFGWFIVTTSACNPCSTDSACALDAPCDCRTDTVSPVFCLYAATKLALMSLYSSRVTS